MALRIDSLETLYQNEKEIVELISQFPNGGNLFVIHPFLLLADIGVELSDRVRQDLVRMDPHLLALSPTPYHALKATKQKQRTRFHVRGLFRRAT